MVAASNCLMAGILSDEHLLEAYLPGWLADQFPCSLRASLTSASLPSKQVNALLTLGSELALLLVARGESELLVALFFVPPDLILYIEETGILVTTGRRLPCMLRLMS